MVETTSLSFAELPRITMHSHLPQGMQKPKSDANPYGGALSNLQMETVVYAGMRHATQLPNGTTAGFFLGDGVGLGKGRQLAGIILDNWNQGRKRHLWVSVSADLMQDATSPRPHPLTLTLSPSPQPSHPDPNPLTITPTLSPLPQP